MIPNTSAIYIHRSFGYEKINEPRIENQAFIFVSEHHFKTTSSNKSMKAKNEVVDFIISELPKDGSLNVLDLGCGEGKHLFAIYDNKEFEFNFLKGVDSGISEGMKPFPTLDLNTNYRKHYDHERELNKNLFEYIRMDITEYILKETNKYDLIILSNILHFFNWQLFLCTLNQCESLT